MTARITDSVICLGKALAKDLPDIEFKKNNWVRLDNGQYVKSGEIIGQRRPHETDVRVHSFPQLWSDTSCGMGGIAGQGFTWAQTTIVVCETNDVAAVYFGTQFAYLVEDITNQNFQDDFMKRILAEVSLKCRYLGA